VCFTPSHTLLTDRQTQVGQTGGDVSGSLGSSPGPTVGGTARSPLGVSSRREMSGVVSGVVSRSRVGLFVVPDLL